MAKPHSIRDIIVKDVARNLRAIFPNARIEGHPAVLHKERSVVTIPALLIIYCGEDNKDGITVRFSQLKRLGKEVFRGNHESLSDADIMITARVSKGGNIKPFDRRDALVVDLIQPDSIDKLEKWIIGLIESELELVPTKKASSS